MGSAKYGPPPFPVEYPRSNAGKAPVAGYKCAYCKEWVSPVLSKENKCPNCGASHE